MNLLEYCVFTVIIQGGDTVVLHRLEKDQRTRGVSPQAVRMQRCDSDAGCAYNVSYFVLYAFDAGCLILAVHKLYAIVKVNEEGG